MTKRVLAVLLFTMVLLAAARGAQTRYPVQYTGQYQGHGTYKTCDMASDKKVAYFSLVDNNKGHTPGVSPTFWVLASAPSKCATTATLPPVPPVVVPPVVVPPVGGLPALIAHAASAAGNTATTPVSTVGANFAQACVRTGTPLKDSMDNAWEPVPGTSVGGYSASNTQMVVAYGLKTSPTHTFQTKDGTPFTVMAWSNIASGPDQVAVQGSWNLQSVGPITTTKPSELVLGCFNGNMNPPTSVPMSVTAPAPFTVVDAVVPSTAGWPNGMASAYAVQAAPGATTILFGSNQRNGSAEAMASFYSTLAPVAPKLAVADPLPEGVVNLAYGVAADGTTRTVCAALSGGVRPFAVQAAGLPSGYVAGPDGCITGLPAGASVDNAVTFSLRDAVGQTASVTTHLSTAQAALALAGGSCPVAKQNTPYSCNALQATGGIGALQYSTSSDPAFEGMPGGTVVDKNTGAITSPRVLDQGVYSNVAAKVTDAHGGVATGTLQFTIQADNDFSAVQLYPKDSVFHLKVRDLPNDTSIRSRFPDYYSGVALRAGFGPGVETGGFPIQKYPANTPMVPVKASFGGNGFPLGPIPCGIGMEADSNQIPQSEASGSPDMHVLGLYLAGTGADGISHGYASYSMYNVYPVTLAGGGCGWGNPLDPNGYGFGAARLPSVGDIQTSYAMPNPGATINAAGTDLLLDAVKYPEVAGGCVPGQECGVITHPLAITVERTGQFYTWPGTAAAPAIHDNCPQPGFTGGDIQPWDQAHPLTCFDGNNQPITVPGQTTVVMGMVFHLPPGTPEPQACAANRVNHILFTALEDYGLKVTDNGLNGNMLGTRDPAWLDWGSLNSCLNQIKLGQFVAPQVWKTAADPTYKSSKILPQYVTP